MIKIQKIKFIAAIVVLILCAPIAATLCCCVGSGIADAATNDHHDSGHHSGKDAHKSHEHSHSDCAHPQLMAVQAEPNIVFQILQDYLTKLTSQLSSKANSTAISILGENASFHNIGPPARYHSAIPLYLQISVLRI